MTFRKSLGLITFLIGLTAVASSGAMAQDDYPNRPIEVIVPFSPGGPLDLGVRFFSDKWAEFLKQPVVIVNKYGASGALASKFVANARPDGYTLLAVGDSPMINARLGRKDVGYDLDSFRQLFAHSKITTFLSVRADSKWKTLPEFFAEAKNNPGKLRYAAMEPSGASHMVMEMLSEVAGVKLNFVPFKTSPECLTALAGGNVEIAVTFALSGVGKAGMTRTLAVSDVERVPDLPEVPTLKELGYPIKYTNQYMGIAAPAKTPEKIIAKWTDAHNKVRAKYAEEIKDKLPQTGQYPYYMDGKEALLSLKEREKLFTEFAKKIGFKVD